MTSKKKVYVYIYFRYEECILFEIFIWAKKKISYKLINMKQPAIVGCNLDNIMEDY